MWIAFDLHEHIAAGCFKDGWSLLIHRMPGSSDKGVFISLHMPENFSHKIDPARPPFLYADDAEIDLGHSITMQLLFSNLGVGDTHYECLDDRVSCRLWHGNLAEGAKGNIVTILSSSNLTFDVFLIPRNTVRINFETTGLREAIKASIGI